MPQTAPGSLDASYDYAIGVTRRAGSNFHLAFRTLPRPMYRAMCVVYAYMRISDDLVDGCDSPAGNPRLALNDWKHKVEQLPDPADHPLFPALGDVMSRCGIERDWLLQVLFGMERDLDWREFPDFNSLSEYCDQVAGMSGLCCQALWGADLSQTRELALTCGRAFQMTNILRDLVEDSSRARCYLPADERVHFGCPEQMVESGRFHPAWRNLIQFQIGRTNAFYAEASELERLLSGPGRRMFRIMFATYHSLLEQIIRDPDVVAVRRVRLTKSQKLKILLMAPHCSLASRFRHCPPRQTDADSTPSAPLGQQLNS
ncbi:phytoene/squalene synthase family protein [Rubinisphaera margarita]|uniref:phytoene/squalene synthase family protein n=1 Tax=Rubinisphaera margarita TaxID=2909586 RepID=UPI001EE7F2BB|nr:phytoene/squalene synthase family protein [Rubinisphaera margarita]MCG6155420.1 squalene/phytoene synthase family protein [Rubinisphaera margarita]